MLKLLLRLLWMWLLLSLDLRLRLLCRLLQAEEQRTDCSGCVGWGEAKCARILLVVRSWGVAFYDSGWVRHFVVVVPLLVLGLMLLW